MTGRTVCGDVLCDAVAGVMMNDARRPDSRLLADFQLQQAALQSCRCGLYPKRKCESASSGSSETKSWIQTQAESLVIATGIPLWKRFLDIFCILLALPALLPMLGLIALVVRVTSPGPVFFVQKRIGYRGRPFDFLKFRSMRVNADTGMHRQHVNQLIRSGVPMVKLDDQKDPRLFPAGRFLRATGLDELPQLINVLRGQMSLVGPRPCIPYEFDDYSPWHKRRCEGLPGLTGLWQVEGKNRTTFEEMVWLDLLYLSKRSLWLDLKIMAKTIPALVSQARKSREAKRGAAQKQTMQAPPQKAAAAVQIAHQA